MPRALLALLAATLLQACASTATSSSQSSAASTTANQVVTAATKRRIDSTLRAYVDSGRVVGASALVWEKGREVYFGAFGMADREANRPMTRDVIAQIFSMTKPVTGVAHDAALGAGEVQARRSARDVPPGVRERPRLRGRRLRRHAGARGAEPADHHRRHHAPHRGIRHQRRREGRRSAASARPIRATATTRITQFSQKLASVPLASQPGTRWAYGISVDVQAALVERVSGQPFGRYVREHILDPLRMRETRYLVPEADRARFAALYSRNAAGALVRAPDSTAKAFNTKPWALEPGAFGFTSTLDDYLRFARMLLNGGELDGVRILRARDGAPDGDEPSSRHGA